MLVNKERNEKNNTLQIKIEKGKNRRGKKGERENTQLKIKNTYFSWFTNLFTKNSIFFSQSTSKFLFSNRKKRNNKFVAMELRRGRRKVLSLTGNLCRSGNR
jgi:hypothetical protein